MPIKIPGQAPDPNPVKQYRSYHKASYSFEQVIADLVDNSIDADATFVEIRLGEQDLDDEPKEHKYLSGPSNLYCLVIDDGKGIREEDMHPVLSRGFDREYDEIELGSYGVGLKDSSLSQAYEVTIFSKVAGSSGMSMRRLSSCLVKKYEAERIFSESDLPPWMRETEGYEAARAALEPLEHGTVILLEGMHKLELKIAAGDREAYTNAIRERCKNYTRLVFQRYLEGVDVPRSDGNSTHKLLDIYWEGREPFHKLRPLDPFCREPEFMDGTCKGTTSLSKEFDTVVGGGGRPSKLSVTAWLLPHRGSYPDVAERQDDLKTTKEGKSEDDGSVGGVGLIKLQGAFIYRNMRLVQFAPDRDPWLGITTEDSHLNQMRLEVHLPPGRLVGGDESQFDINTSKSQVEIAYELRSQLKKWADKPGEKFHDDDPRVVSLKQRAERRNGDDSWPTCPICGSVEHTRRKCPQVPRCQFCNSTRHTGETCKERPACEICGEKTHLTEGHPREPEVPDPPIGDPGGTSTDPEPPLPPTGEGGDGDGRPAPELEHVLVLSSDDGPLISTSVEGAALTVRVNQASPLYASLLEGIKKIEGGKGG